VPALQRSELSTVYQPIVSTADGQLNGFEALLRWYHLTRGSVPPAMVIPLAERSSSIVEIGDWVLKQAWAERGRWQLQLPGADLAMSVNVSTRQLMSRGYVADLHAALDHLGADPRLLTLEITESVFVSDSERAVVVLNDLKDIGVRLALDDFGTGYSSLSYLRQFPLDILKIDRAFVSNLERDRTSQVIVRAVIELAHGLHMSVVAEGVETSEQHQQLSVLGSDSCQGYYFARPMPADTVDELVRLGSGGPLSEAPGARRQALNEPSRPGPHASASATTSRPWRPRRRADSVRDAVDPSSSMRTLRSTRGDARPRLGRLARDRQVRPHAAGVAVIRCCARVGLDVASVFMPSVSRKRYGLGCGCALRRPGPGESHD
jgi:EAL domain-containing protein (putative c-di-GMP-specific phosphodiesterase class I)